MGLLEDLAQHRTSFEASEVRDENWSALGDFYDEIARDVTGEVEDEFYSAISRYGEDVFAARDEGSVEVAGYSDLVRHSANILVSEDPDLGYDIAATQYDLEKKNGVRVVSAIDALLP
ncbi:hypothetical protein ACK3SF_01965 [Candidatus Nanosalina sp. VS9-1]|uniref:hypothetical protein n=1 Tax=Candidatus Nanosalina sp. VS9-1 TaxID=3388566 RepID=UPI0039E0C883